jgi:hypothetical protein
MKLTMISLTLMSFVNAGSAFACPDFGATTYSCSANIGSEAFNVQLLQNNKTTSSYNITRTLRVARNVCDF